MGESKKHIVLLSTIYTGIPSANGICARNLTKALKEMGHNVDVVCYESDKNTSECQDLTIYTVEKPQPFAGNPLCKALHKAKQCISLAFSDATGMMDKRLIDSYYRRMAEIARKKPIDAIVAVFFSIEGVEAMARFKKSHPSTFTVSYELDSIGDGIALSTKNRLINANYDKWLREKYSCIDRIVVMKSHEEYWRKQFGAFAVKMDVADIPVFLPQHDNSLKEYEKCTMVYSGIIEKQYRAPTYLLNVLLEMKNQMDFDFLFFSKGDCEAEIAEAASKYSGIKQMGFVTPEELKKIIAQSGFLISIGNSVSRSLPSKLISYIASGKPIIHFSAQADDVCNEYLSDYPYAIIVDQSRPINDSCNRICNFVHEYAGKVLELERIKEKLHRNDPAYSAELITQLLQA